MWSTSPSPEFVGTCSLDPELGIMILSTLKFKCLAPIMYLGTPCVSASIGSCCTGVRRVPVGGEQAGKDLANKRLYGDNCDAKETLLTSVGDIKR